MKFKDWLKLENVNENTSLSEWSEVNLSEAKGTRYSVEVNYRSKASEALDAFAKIALGYVSAAMKKNDYHVKHVFDEKPMRIWSLAETGMMENGWELFISIQTMVALLYLKVSIIK